VTAISDVLKQHKENGTYRFLKKAESPIDFSSNDYLGLARSEPIRARLIRDLTNGCPLGATGSRLLSGQSEYHEQVEAFLAETFRVESALIFSSGYLANLGVLCAFGSLGTHFFCDELNHASLIDGARLTRANKTVFRHNDLADLEKQLHSTAAHTKVIVSESVFSMDGGFAPLEEIRELASRFDAWVVIDEAHATGAFGDRSLGLLDHRDWSQLISIHTGGKSLGGQGAFVLSDKTFRELMINRSRSFIYNTALSPLHTLQIQYAIETILEQPELAQTLRRNSQHCRNLLASLTESTSQILAVHIGSNEKAIHVASELQNRGFDVRAIRSPTVPVGTERLRITMKSFHDEKTIEDFCHTLRNVLV